MVAALAIAPSSGVVHASTVAAITLTGANQNTNTGYNFAVGGSGQPTQYPSQPEIRYTLTFEVGGVIQGRSYKFGVDENGGHVFPNYIFPTAGSWTVRLRDAADDSSVATLAVTVS